MSSPNEVREQLSFADVDALRGLAGPAGCYLRALADKAGIGLSQMGNRITLTGAPAPVRAAKRALEQLYLVAQQGEPIEEQDVGRAAEWNLKDPSARADHLPAEGIVLPGRDRPIVPKTPNQREYLRAIRQHAIVFGAGPAGTGKTYVAMAMAVAAYRDRQVRRIVLTRPAVEAGEKLGYLPGTIAEKVHPYLRPLYDALHDMMDFDEVLRLIERDVIEVAPLAFMRGRTLHDSFVILDEAQNTTVEQMKMFLTRLGEHSRAVVTGDITQIDLPPRVESGLVHALRLLRSVDGIGAVHFDASDVLRHKLVQRIVLAYEAQSPHGRQADRYRYTPANDEPPAEADRGDHG
jgi:phosphate starvation-inducible protein PhoH and related proteins